MNDALKSLIAEQELFASAEEQEDEDWIAQRGEAEQKEAEVEAMAVEVAPPKTNDKPFGASPEENRKALEAMLPPPEPSAEGQLRVRNLE